MNELDQVKGQSVVMLATNSHLRNLIRGATIVENEIYEIQIEFYHKVVYFMVIYIDFHDLEKDEK